MVPASNISFRDTRTSSNKGGGIHLKSLFEWFIITEVNLMLDGAGTSELIRLECKGIMIQEQKLPGDSSIAGSPLTQAIEINFSNSFSCLSCTVICSFSACTSSSCSEGTSSRGANIAETTCATCTLIGTVYRNFGTYLLEIV